MNLNKLFFLLFAVLMLSCNKDQTEESDSITPESELQPTTSSMRFACPVHTIDPLRSDNLEAITAHASTIVSGIDNVSNVFVIVEQEDFAGNESKLAQAYEKGCVIGIVDPDFSIIKQWADQWLPEYMTISEVDDCYIVCICNKSSVYYGDYVHKDEGHDSDSQYLQCKYFYEPLVVWVNSQFDGTKAGTNEDTNKDDDYYYTIEHTVSFSAKKAIWNCGASSDDDIVQGNGSITYQYKIAPIYVYQHQNGTGGAGDYYDVNATYTIRSANMYHDHVRNSHGWLVTTYSALFLKHFIFNVYIKDSSGNIVPMSYVSNNDPIPESTQGTTEYSHSRSWSLNLGVTLGGSAEKGFEGNGNFNWGINRSNTVSQSIADMSIVNCSEVSKPGWDIECMNTPHYDPQGDHDISNFCPQIARGNLTFHAHWIWYTSRTEDWSEKSLGKLCTTVSCEYDGIGTDSSVRYTRTLSEKGDTFQFSDTSSDEILIAPNRIPFGTVRITNTFDDKNITIANIKIKDKNGVTIAEDNDGKTHEKYYQFNLPLGEYVISFDAGASRSSLKHYEYYDGESNKYNVSRRESEDCILNLYSHFDFREIETGNQ